MCCSYLIFAASTAILGLAVVSLLARARGWLIAAGLLAAPAGFADAIFVPEYWTPEHVISKYFSVEGVMFSFGNGVLITAMPAVFWPQFRLNGSTRILDAVLRCSVPMLLGLVVFFSFWKQGFGNLMIMHAVFAGFAGMFAMLAWLGSLSVLVALSGGIGFFLIYLAQTTVLMWIVPSATEVWSAYGYLGPAPFWPYLPVEEFMWAFLYGALWVSLMAYSFNIPVRKTG